MLHKLSSEDHIACKACGQDFNTTEGRDHHFRQVCPTFLGLVRSLTGAEPYHRSGNPLSSMPDGFHSRRRTAASYGGKSLQGDGGQEQEEGIEQDSGKGSSG